jgi:transketolase
MQNKVQLKEILNFANTLRSKILAIALNAKENSSHFGGSLSTVEIISTLFMKYMNINFDKFSKNRNRFILSKGHSCLAYYAALSELNYFSSSDLLNFEGNDSKLLGHPVMNRQMGIEFSTGSLGMGLGLGVGVALALKKKNMENHVYVLIGDGECNEGSIWESANSAASFDLNNITCILDNNKFQQTGSNIEIMSMGNLSEKWKSFGWNVLNVDGHSINEIDNALSQKFDNSKPKMIVADTIKGKGFSFSENNNEWHHKVLTQKTYDLALTELNKK